MIPGWNATSKRQAACFSPHDLGSLQAVGIRFDRLRAEARAVNVSFPPVLHLHSPQITGTASEPLSSELLRRLRTLELDESTFEQRELATQELDGIAARLTQQLFADGQESDDHVLAIGCHGTGIWGACDAEQPRYSELLDASRLAESFGKTVISDFPARDLARNGVGGPVESHGMWILLADRDQGPGHRWRGLLDVSAHATNFTMISPLDDRARRETSFSYNICAGQRLLAELSSRVPDRAGTLDYGKLAATGRVISELVEIWSATVISNDHVYSWSPYGVSVLPFVYALEQSIYRTASLEDQLASATYFLARQIVNFVLHQVPASYPVGELLVMGEGTQNRLLMRWLSEWLTVIPIRRLDDLGQDRSLLAASVAALAMMHIWHIPLTASRGGEVPRVLGSITPGSPSNWQRVLQEMTSHAPWLLPLREAI